MLRLSPALIIGTFILGFVLLDTVPSSAAPAFAARSSDAAGVQVVVTPKALGPGAKVWEFEVAMNTHIKPLTEDLAQLAVLVDETGRRYTPVGWQGDPPGGHHRKGVLQFSAPAELPKSVELQINNVGGADTRSFRWELK